MNQQAVDALVEASLKGVPQIRFWAGFDDGRCALGILAEKVGELRMTVSDAAGRGFGIEDYCRVARIYGLTAPATCPVCSSPSRTEYDLIADLNDHHDWDFLTIARKLGPDASPGEARP